MPKFVDKMNLPQYRYFHDMTVREEERQDMVSDFFTAEHQINNGNQRGYRDGLMLLGRVRSRLPDFLYMQEDDQKKCRKEIEGKNIRAQAKKMERYIDLLLNLQFFQGLPLKKKKFIEEREAAGIPKEKLRRMYRYSEEEGKYYMETTSIPKLVLVSGELYGEYLGQEFTAQDGERLGRLVAWDVHYIVTVQGREAGETVYLLGREKEGLSLMCLYRDRIVRLGADSAALAGKEEPAAAMLSLLDYLEEVAEADSRRRLSGQEAHTYPGKQARCRKYMDKNSIKVFDMKKDTESGEIEVFRSGRKNAGTGSSRMQGYEMMPHTRRGHYRKCKSGKVVYVKSSIIHKERYEGFQSAHRINRGQG